MTKQTPLGPLPIDWSCAPIGRICKVASGGTPSRKNSEYWGGNIRWAKTAELNQIFINYTSEGITEAGLKNSSAKVFPAGTILMALYGQGKTRGMVGLLQIEAAINQACAAIEPSDCLETEFLFQYLRSKYTNIRNLSNTGGQENLSGDIVKGIQVPLPSLPEQKKIAEILSTWDDALEKLDDLINAKVKQKHGLMQQLLTGRKRLPGFAGEWREKSLGQLFKHRKETKRGDLRLLSITASRGVIDRSELEKKDSSNADKSKYLRIAPGDIGYNTMRMWQGVSALSSLEGIISPAYTVCIPQREIRGEFAAHFFQLPKIVSLFHRYSQGLVSDTLNLKFPNFAQISVTVPDDLKEQAAIAAVLDTADQEISLLKQKRNAVDEQKRGLMQQLLTGKVRVKLEAAEA